MLLQSTFDFDFNEAQNIVIGKIAILPAVAPDGLVVYLTLSGQQGLYLRKQGNWIHLGQVEALSNGAIQVTPISGVQYISVRVDNDTIIINGNGDLEVAENAIGIREIDTANIRINNLATPNANFSMGGYKITNLGSPTLGSDAVNKEYVDQEIAEAISSMGEFMGDWSGPGYPTAGSGDAGVIQKGDWWRLSSAVTIGTHVLEIGDALFAKTNLPGVVDTNWFTLQNNVGEATATALGLVRVSETTDLTATNGDNTSRVVRIGDLLARTATTTRIGLIQLATQTEVNSGSVTTKAVTPGTLAVYVNAQINSRGFAADIGDGTATAIVITHNFGTRDLVPEVYRATSPWDKIIVDVKRPSTNSCSIEFKSAPTAAQYRFVAVKA